MADTKISALTANTTLAAGDLFPHVDISEADSAVKTKRVTLTNLTLAVNIANKITALAALLDDTATSFTPTNASGFMFIRRLGGSAALLSYDATSPTAYVALIGGGAEIVVTTGALAGTTGTDAKISVSPHTDGKIYVENRLGSTVYLGYSTI